MTERTLLLKNALALATMNDAREEFREAAVLIRGREIVAVGPTAEVLAAHPARMTRRSTSPAMSCCRGSSTRTTTCSSR